VESGFSRPSVMLSLDAKRGRSGGSIIRLGFRVVLPAARDIDAPDHR
jgi:hypothetical protein